MTFSNIISIISIHIEIDSYNKHKTNILFITGKFKFYGHLTKVYQHSPPDTKEKHNKDNLYKMSYKISVIENRLRFKTDWSRRYNKHKTNIFTQYKKAWVVWAFNEGESTSWEYKVFNSDGNL